MAITLGAIELPDDLEWLDEFRWSPVAQQIEVTAGGSLLLEEFKQNAGRPITLSSRPDMGCVTRATVLALKALADDHELADQTLTLPDGRTFTVRFRHEGGTAVEALAAYHVSHNRIAELDLYVLTLRLIEVE